MSIPTIRDAIWMVVEEMAEFYDRTGALGQDQAVMIPASISHRFVCNRPSQLLRFAASAAELDAADDAHDARSAPRATAR